MKTELKKELAYIAIITGFSIIVITLLSIKFLSKEDEKKDDTVQIYQAGVYTKEIQLGDVAVSIQLCLDKSNVKSVELVNIDDTFSSMYPLMAPEVKKISEQLSSGKSVDEIVLSDEAQYTEKLILGTVREMLQEHRVSQAP